MCGKHIYGHGLIGEEKECNVFKVYHFDYRGSTVAITDMYGNVTDRFEYDTYGKMVSHVGDSFVIFGYNGRDGVVTDKSGLIYMRARYYSPELRRFVNADIIAGNISNAITLNRYAYANGNPVSLIDPFGLEASRDRDYVETKLQQEAKILYDLCQELGIIISVEDSDETVLFNEFGIAITLSWEISYETETKSNATIDITDSKATLNTPEAKFADDSVGLQAGVYADAEEWAVGTTTSVRYEEWAVETKSQTSLKSTTDSITISYTPDDPLLPKISLTMECEVSHITKLVTAGVAVLAVVAWPAFVAAAGSIVAAAPAMGAMPLPA